MRVLAIILSVFVTTSAWAQDDTALDAAAEWLQLVDTGKYAESWQNADAFFKAQLSESNWDKALVGVRKPLGKVISRSEKLRESLSTLPGAPVGDYLIIQFNTQFQNKQTALETLTLKKTNAQWLPVGYFIK